VRRTKIVATVGPASDSPETLRALIAAGIDVARLNFSHGTHEQHGRVIERIRRLAADAGRPIAILQDLAGPKIRTGPVAGYRRDRDRGSGGASGGKDAAGSDRSGEVELEVGQEFVLTSRSVPGDEHEVGLTYPDLPHDVEPGDPMLLSDGAIELEVVRTTDTDIVCRVVVGGPLSSHKGINLPSRSVSAELPTPQDLDDLEFGMEQGVDLVALSFVRGPDDVERARAHLPSDLRDTPLIAKIEKQEAVERIDAILSVVDGIMVARGDLGVEIPLERVPGVQKSLIDRANRAGRFVVTATQMLGSMVENPRPTRAEVTDVANAVLDGTDAVMLSEETAVGRDPAGVVRMMDRIVREAERDFPHRSWGTRFAAQTHVSAAEAIARSAWQMAEQLEAAAILTLTISGSTTRLVARYRPGVPILAVTPDRHTCRRLAPIWGAMPLHVPETTHVDARRGAGGAGAGAKTSERRGNLTSEDRMIAQAVTAAVDAGLVPAGRTVVVTAGLPLHVPGITNLVRIVEAGDPPAE
jgi:pyruvate kinase